MNILSPQPAQRDCRKTPSLKNVHKNLPQQAQKSPKCCSVHKKPGTFQRFCPTFQKSVFEKALFRQFQRLALPALGWERGLAVETGKAKSQENAQKTRRVPTVSCTHCYALSNSNNGISYIGTVMLVFEQRALETGLL